jgi:hypothetical protein
MNNFIKGFGLIVIALITSSANAIPTLDFSGIIDYDARSQQLSVTSTLIDTHDIFPAPALDGTLNFDAALVSTYSGFGINIGSFGTIAGQDDITVKDGDANILLTGNFSSLTMSGTDNADRGSITGELISTGGSLASEFGTGNLLALQFNLGGTLFNPQMFDSNFSGEINGDIEGRVVEVPEPNMVALLSMGILLIVFASRKSSRSL